MPINSNTFESQLTADGAETNFIGHITQNLIPPNRKHNLLFKFKLSLGLQDPSI